MSRGCLCSRSLIPRVILIPQMILLAVNSPAVLHAPSPFRHLLPDGLFVPVRGGGGYTSITSRWRENERERETPSGHGFHLQSTAPAPPSNPTPPHSLPDTTPPSHAPLISILLCRSSSSYSFPLLSFSSPFLPTRPSLSLPLSLPLPPFSLISVPPHSTTAA